MSMHRAHTYWHTTVVMSNRHTNATRTTSEEAFDRLLSHCSGATGASRLPLSAAAPSRRGRSPCPRLPLPQTPPSSRPPLRRGRRRSGRQRQRPTQTWTGQRGTPSSGTGTGTGVNTRLHVSNAGVSGSNEQSSKFHVG